MADSSFKASLYISVSSWGKDRSRLYWFLLSFLLFFLLSMRFEFTKEGLEASWKLFLVNASVKGYQFSDKAIFTYGPAWFFTHHFYNPKLFWVFILSNAFTSVVISLFIIKTRWKLLSLIFLLWSFFIGQPEEFWPLFIVISLTRLFTVSKLSFPEVLLLLWFAFIGFSKFSYFILITPIIPSIDIVNITERKYRLPIFSLVFVVCMLAAYIILGQNILTLFTYLSNSVQIASGYSKTMGLGLEPQTIRHLLGFYGICSIIELIWQTKKEDKSSYRILFIGLAITWGILMIFKMGYVREDGHIFITQAIFALLFIWIIFLQPKVSILFRFVTLFLLFKLLNLYTLQQSVLKLNWQDNTKSLTFSKKSLDIQYDSVKSRIGINIPIPKTATVDSYPWDLAELILGGYNYYPRPIPQTYSAYTNKLQDINYTHLSEGKSDYILLKIMDIDGRYPTLLLGKSLETLYSNYDVTNNCILDNDTALILKRRISPRKKIVLDSFKSEFSAGDWFILPPQKTEFREAKINFKPTLLGELKNFFLHQDYAWIEVQTASGEIKRFRFIPNVANNGFVLSPLLNSTKDYVQYDSTDNVKRIRVYSDNDDMFNHVINIETTDFDMQEREQPK